MGNDVQLITYADRLGDNLSGLQSLLDNEFRGLFGGVHVLPFFYPIDGTDAGFDPVDHTRVDPRLGDWDDVASLSAKYSFMADLIVNHVSADSAQFQDVRRHGRASAYWDLFLRKSDVFPDGEQTSVTAEEIQTRLTVHGNYARRRQPLRFLDDVQPATARHQRRGAGRACLP